MKIPARPLWSRGKIRIRRETERTFFFYATLAMFLVWAAGKLWGS